MSEATPAAIPATAARINPTPVEARKYVHAALSPSCAVSHAEVATAHAQIFALSAVTNVMNPLTP